MGARWDVVTGRDDRTEIFDVETYRTQVPLPSDHIEWVVRIHERRVLVVPLHPDEELPRLVVRLWLRRLEHSGIE